MIALAAVSEAPLVKPTSQIWVYGSGECDQLGKYPSFLTFPNLMLLFCH